ncbi:MAG: nucleoside-diphosphate sugar epimerase/dehydratase [Pseudomonadota bacterium]|nr:nucleoside-diphosphate sugar epimerase/dehydratase [Pseudomonadota bacterium]
MKILIPTPKKRKLFFLCGDLVIFTFSLYLAFNLRFEFSLPQIYQHQFLKFLPFFIAIKLISFSLFKLYDITWRFVSLNEVWNICKATFLAFIVCSTILFFGRQHQFFIPFPRSILLMDFFLTLVFSVLVRGSKRIYLEKIIPRAKPSAARKAVIIGAGRAGEQIARDLNRRIRELPYQPVAFLDDDQRKIGSLIHGIRVEGDLNSIYRLVPKKKITVAIIAISSATASTLRRIVKLLKSAGIDDIRVLSSIIDSSQAIELTLGDLRNLQIEDLLGRDVVAIDYQMIGSYLHNKRVLITGAAGSIGSEITRQALNFQPSHLILLEIDETELYNLDNNLGINQQTQITSVVGDIRDQVKMQRLFARYQPEVIFHAAACKQVPIMESNADEAVNSNIIGTYNIAFQARKYEAEKFILISTDKAVNPTSVMGATKRIAEYLCTSFNHEEGNTRFLAVRFGNVLGSRGGVLELFLEQLKNGRPLTVTHPEMKRYFMTIPEAVSLVLQSVTLAKGGEVFVLDMGDPLSIVTLAEEVIRLNGMEPYTDIDIEFIGVRPGEKLFEELLTAEEGTRTTCHRKIFTANISNIYNYRQINEIVRRCRNLIQQTDLDNEKVKNFLHQYVKTYADVETVNFVKAQRRTLNQADSNKTA